MRRTAPVGPAHDPFDRRPRALWRVLVPVVLVLGGVVAADVGIASRLGSSPWLYAVRGGARIAIVLGVLTATARWLDRRRLRDYGLRADRAWWSDVAAGAVIGLVIFSLSTAAAAAGGWVRVQEVLSPAATGGLWPVLALALVQLVAVSLWEELLFRGVMITNGAEGFARRRPAATAVVLAAVISTAIFAVIHVPQNLGADVPMAAMLATWISLGGLLAVAYVVTGQLALSLGLHLTVNLALQHVFVLWGEEASDTATILQMEVTGPEVVAGTGGVLQLAAIAVGYLLLLGWVRARHGGVRIRTSLAQPPSERGRDDGARVPTHEERGCATASRR